MSDKPFLYGSHYSAPGYVLFYLVRLGTYDVKGKFTIFYNYTLTFIL